MLEPTREAYATSFDEFLAKPSTMPRFASQKPSLNPTRVRGWRQVQLLVGTVLLVCIGICVLSCIATSKLLKEPPGATTGHVFTKLYHSNDRTPMSSSSIPTTLEHDDGLGRATALRTANVIDHDKELDTPIPLFDPLFDGGYSDYTCLGWRQSGECGPDGPRESQSDKACNVHIVRGASGYCEIKHKITGALRRVLPMHCTSLNEKVSFECSAFEKLLTYGRKALEYTHDENFEYTQNQQMLLRHNNLTSAPSASFFRRGITMVVYDDLLLSAYAGVRWLRSEGSTLPIEMWYRYSETDLNHPLLQLLTANYGVYLRELDDPRATGFFTKLYAVFYSAFDSVLLLDADNFVVKDPSYLFDTPEFTSTGAIFWPDFWKPDHTIFNIHNKSLVWQVFDLPYVDMFEQESGQVLIDRQRHMAALNALMYYGFSIPRLHSEMQLVWGDKDLFRFAWMKTQSSFHMIRRPPGSAGKLNAATNQFCGLTMVQHDPEGKILFLHRNAEKLKENNRIELWTHIQQFKPNAPLDEYNPGWAKVFSAFTNCWGKANDWSAYYTIVSVDVVGLDRLEPALLKFVDEGVIALSK